MREALNERLFRVQESHDQAVQTMLRLVEHVGPEGMVTNRHPGSDEQHVEISQRTGSSVYSKPEPKVIVVKNEENA